MRRAVFISSLATVVDEDQAVKSGRRRGSWISTGSGAGLHQVRVSRWNLSKISSTPHEDQEQSPGGFVDDGNEPGGFFHGFQQGSDEQGHEKERQGQAGGIGRQKPDPFGHVCPGCRPRSGCCPVTGPMHGLHPAPNAMPMTKVPARCTGFCVMWSRFFKRQRLDVDDPQQVKPENQDDGTPDILNDMGVFCED